MSKDLFLRLLQTLITITDAGDQRLVELGKSILNNLFELVRESGKCDAYLLRLIHSAYCNFQGLVDNKDSFAGYPGNFITNDNKRKRLEMSLYPHC